MKINTTGDTDKNGNDIEDYPNTHVVDTISSELTLIGIIPDGVGAAYLDEQGGNWHFRKEDNGELEFVGRHAYVDAKPIRGYIAWVDVAFDDDWRQLSQHAEEELEEPDEWVSLGINEKDFRSRHTTHREQVTGELALEWEMDLNDAKELVADLQSQLEEQLEEKHKEQTPQNV